MQCSAIEFHIQRYVDIDRHFNTDNDNDNDKDKDNDSESDKVTLICWLQDFENAAYGALRG